jgi:hypothetical protein
MCGEIGQWADVAAALLMLSTAIIKRATLRKRVMGVNA